MGEFLKSLLDPSVEAGALALLGGVVAYFWRDFTKHKRTNRAVRGEIRRLLIALCKHKHWYVEELTPQQRLTRPLIPFAYSIFTQQFGNIGALDHAIAAEAIQFYGYIDFVNSLQSKRKEYTNPDEFDQNYIEALEHATTEFFKDIYSCLHAKRKPGQLLEELEQVSGGEE